MSQARRASSREPPYSRHLGRLLAQHDAPRYEGLRDGPGPAAARFEHGVANCLGLGSRPVPQPQPAALEPAHDHVPHLGTDEFVAHTAVAVRLPLRGDEVVGQGALVGRSRREGMKQAFAERLVEVRVLAGEVHRVGGEVLGEVVEGLGEGTIRI